MSPPDTETRRGPGDQAGAAVESFSKAQSNADGDHRTGWDPDYGYVAGYRDVVLHACPEHLDVARECHDCTVTEADGHVDEVTFCPGHLDLAANGCGQWRLAVVGDLFTIVNGYPEPAPSAEQLAREILISLRFDGVVCVPVDAAGEVLVDLVEASTAEILDGPAFDAVAVVPGLRSGGLEIIELAPELAEALHERVHVDFDHVAALQPHAEQQEIDRRRELLYDKVAHQYLPDGRVRLAYRTELVPPSSVLVRGDDGQALARVYGEGDVIITGPLDPADERPWTRGPNDFAGLRTVTADDRARLFTMIRGDESTGEEPGDPEDEPPRLKASDEPHLPDDFWLRRTTFERIRLCARAMGAAPDAVLGFVLALIAAFIPKSLIIDGVDIGMPDASPNLFIALPGVSGRGKGAAARCGRYLIRPPVDLVMAERFKESPLGSMEGMAKEYFTYVADDPSDEKSKRSWQQTVDAVLFNCPEGSILRGQGSRNGQVTVPMLCSAFSGETLGGSYSGKDTRGFILRDFDYRFGLTLAVQHKAAGYLFEESYIGLPSRLVWFSLIDPGAPPPAQRVKRPDPWRWTEPNWAQLQTRMVPSGHREIEAKVMPVAATVAAEIAERHHLVLTGQHEPAELDAHRDLVRLKTSAALAALDGRNHVTADDWSLSGDILDVSDRMRDLVRGTLDREQEIEARKKLKMTGRSAETAELARQSAKARSGTLAGWVERKVLDAGPEGITRGELRRRARSTDRKYIDGAIETLIALVRIHQIGDNVYVAASAA